MTQENESLEEKILKKVNDEYPVSSKNNGLMINFIIRKTSEEIFRRIDDEIKRLKATDSIHEDMPCEICAIINYLEYFKDELNKEFLKK